MLNRIYIVVGMLAIIVLGAAFIAPFLIHWGDYRTRMEALATTVLGTPVTIRGDISFALLPQPRLDFTDVLVGSAEEPAATVDSVEAEFSLLDFLRDNYDVTRLVLRGPVMDFSVDDSGLFGSGVNVVGASGVALAEASIVDGTIRLMDKRAEQNFVASGVDGELKLSSFAGPFQFQGSGTYGDQRYSVRLNASRIDAADQTRLSLFVQPDGGAFALSTEGLLTPGIAPKFDGTLSYRETPPLADNADDIRGDLVLESKITASTDRVVLSGYTLQPDENRAGTRLTGAASIQLGARRSFDAVVSGGVFSLPPRDAKEDASTLPYEAVRLLAELPAPLLPPMRGRLGLDLGEVGLRGFALRDVRLDASTDGNSWTVEQFMAQLPGDSTLRASGDLSRETSHPAFRGQFSLTSERLDGLAYLWRKPDDDNNALFNQAGAMSGNVMLTGDALRVSEAELTLNGVAHAVDVRIGFGEEKRLDVVGHFAGLGQAGSAVLGALLPDVMAEPRFGISFPEGSFSLTSQEARVLGYDGADMVAEGQWTADTLSFARLSAKDWGGLGFDATLEGRGSLAAPELSGSGRVTVAAGDAPALAGLYQLLGTPPDWRRFLARSAPAEVLADLSPRDSDGAQVLTLGGTLGAAKLDLRATLGDGLIAMTTSPLRLTATLEAADSVALSEQIGLGSATLFEGDAMLVSLGLVGTPSNSLDSRINISSGEEMLGFAGSLVATDAGEVQGTGTLDIALADAGGVAQIIGAPGISLPQASANALLHFEGDRVARLTDIAGTSGDTAFSGALTLARTGDSAAVTGDIAIDSVSVPGLAATMFGRAALVAGDSGWPAGPISIGDSSRTVRGTVAVTARTMTMGPDNAEGPVRFDVIWDDSRLRLARLEATLGAGTATLDLSVCCAGALSDKTISGRLSLTDAAIASIAPPAAAQALSGALTGGLQFDGTGASLAEVAKSLAGEGNVTVSNFAVSQLSPKVFATLAGLDDVLNMDGDALRTIIAQGLEQGSFSAPTAAGAFSIAGGVLRLGNFLVDGEGARLAGDLTADLGNLALSGTFALTPNGDQDANGLIGTDTARIFNRINGTLAAPETSLDLNEMVAAIQVRANELEVDRLEALRAADAERQRAAAEARNKLIEAQRQRAAEEAARLAAEEAAQQAAEAEAQRAIEAQQPATTSPQSNQTLQGPIDLGLPPPVNQPNDFTVNRPLGSPIR